MRESNFLTLATTAMLIAWFLWGVVLVLVAPEDLGALSVVLFLATLWVAFFTSFLILFYFIRVRVLHRTPPFRQFRMIFREALLSATLICVILLFFRNTSAPVWNFFLLMGGFILFEVLIILIYDKRNYKKVRKDPSTGKRGNKKDT